MERVELLEAALTAASNKWYYDRAGREARKNGMKPCAERGKVIRAEYKAALAAAGLPSGASYELIAGLLK